MQAEEPKSLTVAHKVAFRSFSVDIECILMTRRPTKLFWWKNVLACHTSTIWRRCCFQAPTAQPMNHKALINALSPQSLCAPTMYAENFCRWTLGKFSQLIACMNESRRSYFWRRKVEKTLKYFAGRAWITAMCAFRCFVVAQEILFGIRYGKIISAEFAHRFIRLKCPNLFLAVKLISHLTGFFPFREQSNETSPH